MADYMDGEVASLRCQVQALKMEVESERHGRQVAEVRAIYWERALVAYAAAECSSDVHEIAETERAVDAAKAALEALGVEP